MRAGEDCRVTPGFSIRCYNPGQSLRLDLTARQPSVGLEDAGMSGWAVACFRERGVLGVLAAEAVEARGGRSPAPHRIFRRPAYLRAELPASHRATRRSALPHRCAIRSCTCLAECASRRSLRSAAATSGGWTNTLPATASGGSSPQLAPPRLSSAPRALASIWTARRRRDPQAAYLPAATWTPPSQACQRGRPPDTRAERIGHLPAGRVIDGRP